MLSIVNWANQVGNYAQLIPFIFCLVAIFYYALVIYCATDFLSQFTEHNSSFHPPISILKPLCGSDSETYENLASFCRQDYPNYQIIFGVQDSTDPAIAVVKQLIQDFPTIDLRLAVSDRTIGLNLKISNLANAADKADHAILLTSDGDIRVAPDYLISVVQPLIRASVGVVTCMYRSQVQSGITNFESLGISTELAPTTLVSRKLSGMNFGIGATIVIRKSVLEEIGGFQTVANYLHDDFHLGRMPFDLGYQVVLSQYVVSHGLDTVSLPDLIQHQTRWNRGIRVCQPWGYAGQIFTFGTVASLVFLLTAPASKVSWALLGLTWFFRLAMAWMVGVKVLNDPIVKKLFWLIPLSDLLRFSLWGYGFLGDRIEWRGRQLKITRDGQLAALD